MSARKISFDQGAFCFHKTDLKGVFPLVVTEKIKDEDKVNVSWMNKAGNLKNSMLHINCLRPAVM
jgi:hypothetical protein